MNDVREKAEALLELIGNHKSLPAFPRGGNLSVLDHVRELCRAVLARESLCGELLGALDLADDCLGDEGYGVYVGSCRDSIRAITAKANAAGITLTKQGAEGT